MSSDASWNIVLTQLQKITQYLKEKVWKNPQEKKSE